MEQQLARMTREELEKAFIEVAHKYVAVADELRVLKEKLEEKKDK